VAGGQFVLPHAGVVAAAIGALGLRVPYWYTPDSGLSIEQLAEIHVGLSLRMVGAKA
jgi:hypothetical protein